MIPEKENGKKKKEQKEKKKRRMEVAEATMETTNKGSKRKTKELKKRKKGGGIKSALSNVELDILFERLGLNALNSLITKTLGEEINYIKVGEIKYAALHFKFHWIGARFKRVEKDVMEVLIFDSAPCEAVHYDIDKWLKKVQKTTGVNFNIKVKRVPRQVRGSNECGIHVLRNAICMDMSEESNKYLSLTELRGPLEELLSNYKKELKEKIIKMMRGQKNKGKLQIWGGRRNIEEEDSETEDDEEVLDIDFLLKEYPRTGNTYRLETMTLKELKEEINKTITKQNKPWQGLAIGTELRHRTMLDKCQNWIGKIDVERDDIAADTFLIARFLEEKVRNNWTSGTLQNYLGSLSAALRLLPLYRQGSPSIYTGERYRAAVKRAQI
eukprot:Tbor_TRINITY_DN6202_c1_g1::TRINITY_DN6202_c1_g1_i4::g.1986::m.1986